jgi:hypothetical protein
LVNRFDKLIRRLKITVKLNQSVIHLIYVLAGFSVMLGVLVGIGINQPRGTSIKTWCYGYLAIAVFFDILVVLALLFQISWLTELLLGLSAGAATGLGIHVAHHISEEGHGDTSESSKERSLFGF